MKNSNEGLKVLKQNSLILMNVFKSFSIYAKGMFLICGCFIHKHNNSAVNNK